jgi:hypothetical protein
MKVFNQEVLCVISRTHATWLASIVRGHDREVAESQMASGHDQCSRHLTTSSLHEDVRLLRRGERAG